jgi:hypothetical protein
MSKPTLIRAADLQSVVGGADPYVERVKQDYPAAHCFPPGRREGSSTFQVFSDPRRKRPSTKFLGEGATSELAWQAASSNVSHP